MEILLPNVTPADVGSWQGLLTTAGTPTPVQERLNVELNSIVDVDAEGYAEAAE